jgi:hypothetical protein
LSYKMPAKRFAYYQSFFRFKSNFFSWGYHRRYAINDRLFLRRFQGIADRSNIERPTWMELRFDPKLILHYIGRHLSGPILWAVLLKDPNQRPPAELVTADLVRFAHNWNSGMIPSLQRRIFDIPCGLPRE